MKVFKVFLSLKWYEFSEWFKEYWIGIAIILWFVGWTIVGGVSNVWWFTDPSTGENCARGFGCGLGLVVGIGVIWALSCLVKWGIAKMRSNWESAKTIVEFEKNSKGKRCPTCSSLLTFGHRKTNYWLYCGTCKVAIERRWF